MVRRASKPDEAAYVSEMVRRIAAILLLGAALDKNYADSKAVAVEWETARPSFYGREQGSHLGRPRAGHSIDQLPGDL